MSALPQDFAELQQPATEEEIDAFLADLKGALLAKKRALKKKDLQHYEANKEKVLRNWIGFIEWSVQSFRDDIHA